MVIALILHAAAQERPGCAGPPATRGFVLAALDQAEAAYPGGDAASVARFRASMDAVDAALPCLVEVLVPSTVSRLHRDQGLRAWLDRFKEPPLAAERYFAAARRIEPSLTFPRALLGEGDPEVEAYTSATAPETLGELSAQDGLQPWVDGDPGAVYPLAVPTLVQWTGEGDVLVCSEYHLPGAPLRCGGEARGAGGTSGRALVTSGAATLAVGVGWQVWQVARERQLDLAACAAGIGCPWTAASVPGLQAEARRSQIGAAVTLSLGGSLLVGGLWELRREAR